MKKLSLLSLFFVLILASCGPKPEEQVKEFALKFGEFVNNNQTDYIMEYYPDFRPLDSLVSLPLSDIIVSPDEIPGQYLIEYSPEIQILVSLTDDGNIYVEETRGLLAFDQEKMELAKRTGMWESNLSDLELSKRMNDESFFQYINSKVSLDNIISVGNFIQPNTDEGYYILKNNSSNFISGKDYEIIVEISTPVYAEGTNAVDRWDKVKKIEPGLDIQPNGEAKYHSPVVWTIFLGPVGPEKEITKIQWKLTPEQIQEKFFSFTGNEYKEYLDLHKGEGLARPAQETENAEQLKKALPTFNMIVNGVGELYGVEEVAKKLTYLGYARQGKISKSESDGEVHEGGTITLTLNSQDRPYVTVVLTTDSFYGTEILGNEEMEYGGFSSEYKVTFAKAEDAENFYNEIKSHNLSGWVTVEKNGNTITFNTYGD